MENDDDLYEDQAEENEEDLFADPMVAARRARLIELGIDPALID